MEILYKDKICIIPVKPVGFVCEDGCKNSIITAVKDELGIDTFPVHRIDKVAGGALLLATNSKSADTLKNGFEKEYVFVLCGKPCEDGGVYEDFLYHDTRTNKSFVVKKQRAGVRKAALEYSVIACGEGYTLVKAKMHTGRTHQIRLQFSSRNTPLYGDKRYGGRGEGDVALWSYKLSFLTGKDIKTVVSLPPVNIYPWSIFKKELTELCQM